MKKILAFFLCFSFLFLIGFSVLAEEPAQESLPTPRVLPGSILYPLKMLGENIRSIFSFGFETRMKRAQELAAMRLAEIKALAEKDGLIGLNLAAERYQRQQEKMVELASRKDEIQEELTDRVVKTASRHLQILDQIAEQSSEQSRSALARARLAAQRGQVRVITALNQISPSLARKKHQQIMEQKMDNLEEQIQEKKEGGLIIGDWRAHLEAFKELKGDPGPETVEWSVGAVEQMDRLEDRAAEMIELREKIWSARIKAIEVQVAEMKRYRQENRWAEVQDNFAEAALRRVALLKQRIQEMAELDCPAEEKEECLAARQRIVDVLVNEYEKYSSLGESVIQELEARSVDLTEERLHQTSQKAMEALEQVYDRAPEEARKGLDQAIRSTERLRQMTGEALNLDQASVSNRPGVRRIQERVRQEIRPQLERIRGALDQR